MDKEKVKEIFGEYWDGIKDKSLWNLSNKEFENIAYKQVAEELKQGDYKPHIQLKAVEKAKGNKEVIDASSLSSGVYLLRMQAGYFIDTKKITLIK